MLRRSAVPILLVCALCAWTWPRSKTASNPLLKFDPAYFSSKKEYLWTLKGGKFAEQGRWDKAFELYGKALRSNPKSWALYWLALTHESAAAEIIVQWHTQSSNPKGGKNLFKNSAGQRLDEEAIDQQLQAALAAYRKAVAAFPQEAAARYRLGKALLDWTMDPQAAEPELSKAADLDPDNPFYRLAHAHCMFALKNFDVAKRQADRALESALPAAQAEARWVLGMVALEQSNVLKSIQEFETAQDLDPSLVQCRYYLALARERLRRPETAIRDHRKFLKEFTPRTLDQIRLMDSSRQTLQRLEGSPQK